MTHPNPHKIDLKTRAELMSSMEEEVVKGRAKKDDCAKTIVVRHTEIMDLHFIVRLTHWDWSEGKKRPVGTILKEFPTKSLRLAINKYNSW
jgi:hypothetical protein